MSILSNVANATMREFLQAVIAREVDDSVVEYAERQIAKLDARNAKRASTQSKTQKANEPIKVAILEALAEKAMTAAEIGAACGITTQKASALTRALVLEGKVSSTEVKVKGKGKVKSYSLADGDEIVAGVDEEEEGE